MSVRPNLTHIALLATAALALSACGGGGSGSSGRTSTAGKPGGRSAAGSVQMRFVNLLPPGSAPVDVVSGPVSVGNPVSGAPVTGALAAGTKVVTGLTAGTVSDWLAVPSNGVVWMQSAGKVLNIVTYPKSAGDRTTVGVGMDENAAVNTNEYEERDGKVAGSSGTVGGTNPLTAPAGKNLIIGNGLGNGIPSKSSSGYSFTLGRVGKGCLDSPGRTTDSGPTVGAEVPFFADPGAVDLAWFADPRCRQADSATVHVTLDPGEQAYAFTWFSDATHLRLLFVPVRKAGAGNAGVIDSGPGPVFSEGNTTTTNG
jgi:hypothetical protein